MGYNNLNLYMKVFIVSSLQPFGHYSQILTNALARNPAFKVYVGAEISEANKTLKDCGTVFSIWEKGPFFFLPLLKKINEIKPDIIHLQHEFMMYGGPLSSMTFVVFLLILKILGYPVVVTIHAVLDLQHLNDDFIDAFHLKSSLAKPSFLKGFFSTVLWMVSRISDGIVCHTRTAVKLLTNQYHVSKKKIHVIPACIPEKKVHSQNPEKYFLYFGYITPRKGLEMIIKAFIAFHENNNKYSLRIAGGTIPGQEQYVTHIQKQVKKYPFIKFEGEMKQEKALDRLFQNAYAVINPAKINVGSSGPLYQARGYHSCILASNVDHLREDIQDLQNGILVDNDEWKNAFEQIVSDPALRDTLIRNTIDLAHKRSPENTALQYKKYYSTFLTNES